LKALPVWLTCLATLASVGVGYWIGTKTASVSERGLAINDVQARIDQAQAASEKESGLAARFTSASGQLASDNPDVRMAGAYALERVAADEPTHYATVVRDLFVAFLHSHDRATTVPPSPYHPIVQGGSPTASLTAPPTLIDFSAFPTPQGAPRVASPSADVEAVVLILARGHVWGDAAMEHLRLDHLDLAGIDLNGCPGSRSRDCNSATRFGPPKRTACSLRGADFDDSDLRGADLAGCDLTQTTWVDTDIEGASLVSTDLTKALFLGTLSEHADFAHSEMDGMMSAGVDYYGAFLSPVVMHDVFFSDSFMVNAFFYGDAPQPGPVIELSGDFVADDLEGAQFGPGIKVRASFAYSRMVGATFAPAVWERVDLRSADVSGCSVQGADFHRVDDDLGLLHLKCTTYGDVRWPISPGGAGK
jgi:uncharacterized protein YjbI with pentapeptide repeats